MTETFDRGALRAELERDEARRGRPYTDTEGHATIGVGWNLDAAPLPDSIIDQMLDLKIDEAVKVLDPLVPDWRDLTPDRQRVLLNMAFNLGHRLAEFDRMIQAVNEYLEGDTAAALDRAAHEMLSSKWAGQVKARALRLAARFMAAS